MTTITPAPGTFLHVTAADRGHVFTRVVALLSAAGRAVPFHRDSRWNLAGSTNFDDRDAPRAAHDLQAIATYREHG
ncbi:hypothetical protein ACIP5Y_42190 [Nocardia sp. NPDC088792]|uniref:hypothetical protein n=1 Tax=Nocardia sp. NPDC088792 TaxID=3364332 RepID=UPI0038097E26